MYKDLFKKKRRIPRKFWKLLFLFASLSIILLLVQAAITWWYEPVVIVRIGEFSLSAEVDDLNLADKIDRPRLSLSAPKIYGSLFIKIKNIGRYSAKNITLNFTPQYCKLGKLYIWKTDNDCAVKIASPADQGPSSDFALEEARPPGPGRYFIGVKELRPGSEVQLKFTIYRQEGRQPIFKFAKILSSNSKVKAFYYRR